MCVMTYLLSLPLWERGFKRLRSRPPALLGTVGRSPYESVDLNVRDIQNSFQYSRSPCGSVDLNARTTLRPMGPVVAPLVGAVRKIKKCNRKSRPWLFLFFPFSPTL